MKRETRLSDEKGRDVKPGRGHSGRTRLPSSAKESAPQDLSGGGCRKEMQPQVKPPLPPPARASFSSVLFTSPGQTMATQRPSGQAPLLQELPH